MIIIMMLGPTRFEISPMAMQKFKMGRKIPFASHDVLGAEPVLEDMGPDNESVSIEATLKPEHFGGLGELDLLKEARDAAVPLPLMRGDFSPMGFYVIEELEEKHDHLNELGIGREIEIEIKLKSVATPGPDLAFAILNLLGR